MAQTVKNLPAMLEIWVRFLGQEDPPEKGIATHSSIHAYRIPGTEEPCGLQSMGSQSQTRLKTLTIALMVATPCTVAHQALLSMGFLRQE